MKRFLKTSVAIGLALTMAAPLAMAQQYPPGPPSHPAPPPRPVDHTKIINNNSEHTTINHTTIVNRAPTPIYNHGPVPAPYYHPPVAHQQTYGFSGHYWRNGDRYTGSRAVEPNWEHYHAQRPPGGYEWVHDGSQLVLIGIASGVVAGVLANAAYQ